MAFRLVVSDIDGTLLDEQGTLTAKTRRVVQRVQRAGIRFVLATSRRWTGAQPVAQALGLRGPLIIYDGIQTRSFPSGEVLAEECLDSDLAGQAAQVLAEHHLQPIFQYGTPQVERLVVGKPPESPDAALYTTGYLSTFSSQVQEVPLEELVSSPPSPLRMVAFGAYEQLLTVSAELDRLKCGWQVLPQGSYGASELSVFAQGASKGAAAQSLCRKLGISPAEVFAIGDGLNDITLLQLAGLGVAMANADEEVKAVAQVMALSNKENGAAMAIERFVLSSASAHHPLPEVI
jgi:Cof subfamily protein (haloacid dehalogenase superfamily)